MHLEYGRPTKMLGKRPGDLVIGIIVSLLFGVGSGALSFVLMIANGMNDTLATIGALGVLAIMIAFCLIGTILWLRRNVT